MKREFFYMVRTKIIFLFVVVIGIMTAVFFYFSNQSKQIVYEKVSETNRNLLNFYGQILEEKFNSAEAFLVSQRLRPNLYLGLDHPSQSVENYLASFSTHDFFSDSTFGEESFDYIFAYAPSSDTYVDYGYSFTDRKESEFESILRQEITEKHLISEKWSIIKINQEYSIYYIIPVHDIYLGCVIDLQGLKGKLMNAQKAEEGVLFFDAEGNSLQEEMKIDISMLPNAKSANGEAILLNNRKYLANSIVICHDVLTLMYYVEQEYLSGQLAKANQVFIIFIPVILAVSIAGIWLLWNSLITPLSNLLQGVEELTKGNFHFQLKECKHGEFKKLIGAFQQMSKEIWKLKIDIYEEQIMRQKTQLLFLQNQLKPHFLINCLNNLRTLELTKQHEEFQNLITKIGAYMRASLSSKGTSTLEEELQNTLNYIDIQKVRYAKKFDTQITCCKELLETNIPAQILQCFIENAIKYQLNEDKILHIFVNIDFADSDYEFMRIIIMDNGKGFDAEVLEMLNTGRQIKKEGRSCIGIYNVILRVKIYYQNKAKIYFSNDDKLGARIEMLLPIE